VWRVFPFDFSTYPFPWSTVARLVLAVAIAGSSLALLIQLARLTRAAP
jgi:hypothetical protein